MINYTALSQESTAWNVSPALLSALTLSLHVSPNTQSEELCQAGNCMVADNIAVNK